MSYQPPELDKDFELFLRRWTGCGCCECTTGFEPGTCPWCELAALVKAKMTPAQDFVSEPASPTQSTHELWRNAVHLAVTLYRNRPPGCCAAAVLDDWNDDLPWAAAALSRAKAANHADCIQLCEALVNMSRPQRRRLINHVIAARSGS